MRKAIPAAIIIAVFLLFGLNGCYTKLKFAGPVPALEAPTGGIAPVWEFSYGWYRPGVEIYDSYHGYYYGRWWDECSWCGQYYSSNNDDNSTMDDESISESGKITRRGNDSYPHHPYQYVIPSDNGSQPSADPIPPAKFDQSKNNNKTQSNSAKSGNSGKIKKRGRR